MNIVVASVAGVAFACALLVPTCFGVSATAVSATPNQDVEISSVVSTADASPQVGDYITVGGLYYTVTATGASPEVSVGYYTYSPSSCAPVDGEFQGGDLVIPSTVSYEGTDYTVTSIERFAFYKETGITSIELPSTVKTVQQYAFSRCSGVEKLTLHEGLETVEEYGLALGTDDGRSALKELDIPASVTTIGPGGFRYLRYLENLSFEEGDEPLSIGGAAFAGSTIAAAYNKSLATLEIPERVTNIGTAAFAYCTGLTKVVFHCDTTGMYYKAGDSSSYNTTGWFYKMPVGSATVLFEKGEAPLYWDENIKGYMRCGFFSSQAAAASGSSPIATADVAYGTMCLSMAQAPSATSVLSGEVPSLPAGNYNSWVYTGAGSQRVTLAGSLYPALVDSSSIASATVLSNGAQVRPDYDYESFNQTSFLASITVYDYNGNLLKKDVDYEISLQRESSLGDCSLVVKGVGSYSSQKSVSFSIGLDSFTVDDGSGHALVYSVISQPKNGHAGTVYLGSGEGNAYQDGFDDAVSIDVPDEVTEEVTGESFSFKVEGINKAAFKGFDKLECVTTGANVEEICDEAFNGCTALTKVVLSEGLQRIDDNSFYNCTSLKEVQFPNSLKLLGKTSAQSSVGGSYAFGNCTNLEQVTFGTLGGGGVAKISGNVFSGCTKLASISMNNNVSGFNAYALYGLSSLKTLTGWESVSDIQNMAISQCSNLDDFGCGELGTLKLGDHECLICVGVFSGCEKIDKLVLGSNIVAGNPDRMASGVGVFENTSVDKIVFEGDWKEIPVGLFRGCDNLTEVTLPQGLEDTGRAAFSSCQGLTKISIPDSVSYVGENCFTGCSSLENIEFEGTNRNLEFGTSAFRLCTSLKEFTVPEGVVELPTGLFAGCGSLTKITLPSTLQTIGTSCFGTYVATAGLSTTTTVACDKLSQINIPDTVSSIGESAFKDCKSLSGVLKAEGLESIGDTCFYGCSSLEGVQTGSKLASIGSSAFYGCANLRVFGPASSEDDGAVIPASVSSLGTHVFCGCSSLDKVSCYANVASIPKGMFSRCSSLKSVEMGNGVESLGEAVFQGCESLESAELSQKLQVIGDQAFQDCDHLLSVTAPATLKTVGANAFEACQRLAWVDLTGCDLAALEIGSNAFQTTSARTDIIVMAPAPANLDPGSGSVVAIEVANDASYQGIAVQGVTVTRAGKAASDAQISYEGNNGVGTATATIELGTFSKQVEFQIAASRLDASACSLAKTDVPYTGGACTPEVTVRGLDSSAYTVSYASNTKIGTGTATVAPVDGVGGDPVKLSFTISAKKGATYTSGSLTYKVLTAPAGKAGTVAVTACKKSASKVVVPATLTIGGVAFKVTALSAGALKSHVKLTKLTLGSNIASLGKQALFGCKKLSALVFMSKSAPKCAKKSVKGLSSKLVVGCKGAPKKFQNALTKGGMSKKTKVVRV